MIIYAYPGFIIKKKAEKAKVPALLLLFFFVCCLGFTDLASAATDTSVIGLLSRSILLKNLQLDSIKKELNAGRSRITELNKREGSYLEQLQELDKNIRISQVYVLGLSAGIDSLAVVIAVLRDTVKSLTSLLTTQQLAMENRLKTLYKTGQPSTFMLLLQAQTVTDAVSKVKYFQQLNQYDKELVRSIDSTRSLTVNKQKSLEIKEADLVLLKKQKDVERQTYEKEVAERKKLLAKVQEEKRSYLALIKELAQAQNSLNGLIRQLETKRTKTKAELERRTSSNFEQLKGKLPWPLKGEVLRDFGKIVHPVYGTVTMNNGIDIGAEGESMVVAIAPGFVEYVGSMRGYGKFVILNHANGFLSVYADLSRINVAQNQEVASGEAIGYIGSAKGGNVKAKLHFQIRHAVETLNPVLWLKKRE